jgi:hypothetical protein
MRDLLVLDSNIVQIEDVGGSNPLCSTIFRKMASAVKGRSLPLPPLFGAE